MNGLFSGLNIPYLLILAGVSAGILLLLWLGQRAALNRLSGALRREDMAAYNAMLNSLPYRLVLRKGTAGILRLEGAIYSGDEAAVRRACQALEAVRTKPGEKLNWYRKTLAFAVTSGQAEEARRCLQKLQDLLRDEKDPKLREVLRDAQLLVGVYIERDTALAGQLSALAETQQGVRKGLTQYRLAKLYHFANRPNAAEKALRQAVENLEGSPWRQVAAQALEDPGILEVR